MAQRCSQRVVMPTRLAGVPRSVYESTSTPVGLWRAMLLVRSSACKLYALPVGFMPVIESISKKVVDTEFPPRYLSKASRNSIFKKQRIDVELSCADTALPPLAEDAEAEACSGYIPPTQRAVQEANEDLDQDGGSKVVDIPDMCLIFPDDGYLEVFSAGREGVRRSCGHEVLGTAACSVTPEPIDYEGLTAQLTQAVKPHISQLIDFAPDKRGTAGLIVDSFIPILRSLHAEFPTFDATRRLIVGRLATEVRKMRSRSRPLLLNTKMTCCTNMSIVQFEPEPLSLRSQWLRSAWGPDVFSSSLCICKKGLYRAVRGPIVSRGHVDRHHQSTVRQTCSGEGAEVEVECFREATTERPGPLRTVGTRTST
ncbi:hypothetical protein SCP_1502060 [Sparassis crispa]|uniref:Uncharacterized protein n=1 Tax=Sparassis crispa TaxID=139825 RepID=A0A401H450_9APHY|nr:hypothetical protein SCP_1501890 [Sparassis crispa]XP_027620107.1 hypothetical protein SCP_1502020 [Sparassis crispa]XP_027620111.1 hypothetical protein SCP_1502060 [Sparassis crispa]GBE89181.1 hypothetical protein SCP_1501890 [Sparassis crispa]GBE89194.1 hypothetical protein SCP_1502020 [Sparassis crispa]GBE89198.1 hypothetical protein SCP_1502060 [Sparassis crispa]